MVSNAIPDMEQYSTEKTADMANNTVTNMKLKESQKWNAVLFAALVFLTAANVGASYLAVFAAKDIKVDSNTGKLLVKSNDKPVVVATSGPTGHSTLQIPHASNAGCMSTEQATDLFHRVMEGNSEVLELHHQDPNSNESDEKSPFMTVGLTASGAYFDETKACLRATDNSGNMLCFLFNTTQCDNQAAMADGAGRRFLRGEEGFEMTTDIRRTLFHNQRRLKAETDRSRSATTMDNSYAKIASNIFNSVTAVFSHVGVPNTTGFFFVP